MYFFSFLFYEDKVNDPNDISTKTASFDSF